MQSNRTPSASASRTRVPSAGPSGFSQPRTLAGGRGGAANGLTPSSGPSFSQIQASYAALMEDDTYTPPQANASASRGRGVARGGAGGAPPRRPSHSGPTTHTTRSHATDDPSSYKLDSLVRRGSNPSATNGSARVGGTRGGGGPNNMNASLSTSSVGRTAGGGTTAHDGNALAQWSLPVETNKGQQTLGIGGGAGAGGIHSGFFYNDGHDFNSDDDDVNNNALYYGDEQLRTGVTKKGTVAMSPGRIRRTPQSSNEVSPTMGGGVGGRGRGGALSSSGRGAQPPSAGPRRSSASTVEVLNNEHRMTAKGRQIRQDVDGMMDAYYGNGGVNDYNNLGSTPYAMVGNRLRGGAGVVEDDTNTQHIDVRTSNVRGGSASNRSVLTSCTAPTTSDGPMAKPQTALVRMNPQWQRGPKNETGRVFDASDRNLLCMDVRGDMAVVGSADHGLKVFDINTMREKRNLYGKKCGHTEWVTSVVYLDDGRILSGGMDSKLCLWHATALKCDDLLGHTGSISQVDVNASGIAVSASYDRTLRVWNCGTRSCVSSLVGHGQPVMSFAWAGQMIMSGDRRGTVKVWDIESSACAATYETKGGQIGALGHLLHPELGQISMVGDQKGTVSIFDFRRSGANPIFAETLHPGGVVSSLKGIPLSGGGGLIASAGADKKIKILDPRMSFRPIHTLTDHTDFIYSMETFGDLIVSGGGNGWLLVHDTKTGKCLYGLGANAAAVRCIFPTNEHLVVAGDDGKAMVYDF